MHKSVKWIRNIIIIIFLLILLFIVILHMPFARNIIRGKLEAYLTAKTSGQFHIASIDYRLPNWIQMNGVFVQNKSGDTILAGERMRVDMNLVKLLQGKYEINKISLEKVYLDAVKKQGDSTFNYQFLIDAFTTKPNAVKKDTTPLVFSLKEIHVLQSGVKWIDPAGGFVLNTSIGKMDLLIDSIDIYKSRYNIREAGISDVVFDLQISPRAVPDTLAIKSTLPYINLGTTHISKTHFIYKDANAGVNTDDVFTDLQFTSLHLQPWGSILMDKVLLSNSDIAVNRPSFTNAKIRLDTLSGKIVNDSLGVFHIREAVLVNNHFVYNDVAQPFVKSGFDLHHIDLKKVMVNANHIDYTGKNMNASVVFASGTDTSGLVLDSLYGNFAVSDSVINFNNFLVRTPRSMIKGAAYLYPYSFLSGNRANLQNTIRLNNNIISKADLQLLMPDLARVYAKQLQGIATIYITAEADGNAQRAVIHHLIAHSDRNDVSIDASGTVTNARFKKAMRFDARIYQMTITRNVVQGFMTRQARQQLQLPPSFHINGTVRGSMTELDNALTASSAYGTAIINGKLRNYTSPRNIGYNLKIIAKNLETGKWVKQDSLFGKINGTVTLKGSGLDYKTANIQSGIDLASFRIKQHTYTGIHVNLSGKKSNYDFTGKTNDPLLQTSFTGTTLLNQSYPVVKSFINIQYANPFALGWYADTLSFKTQANIDLKNLDPSYLTAFVRLDSTVVFRNKSSFRIDSLLAKGYVDSGKTFITVNSSPLDATIKGVYRYTELGNIFQQTINRYTNKTTTGPPVSHYNIDMSADVKPDPLYAVLIPGLFFDKNMLLRGRIADSKGDSLRFMDISVPALVYNGNSVAALNAHAVDHNDSLTFTAQADTVRVGAVQLYTTSIKGGWQNNNLAAVFSTNDSKGRERYAFAIAGKDAGNQLYQVQLNDNLKLNYDSWQVNGKNNILFNQTGFNISQLSISKGLEQIALNSINGELNAPLDVKISRFSLHNITSLYHADSLQIDGILNAAVRVADINKNVPTLDGTLSVDSLQYQQVLLGKLDVKATAAGAESVTLNGTLTGNGNNIDLKGNYNQQTINAQLNLNPVQFKTIELFTQGLLAHSSGTVTGPISITGNVKSPEWNGALRFDSINTRVAQYGTLLKVDGQTIELKYPVITLQQFTVKDSAGHEVIINGILTQNKKQIPDANLTVKTTDFIAMNNTAVGNSQLYGTAIVDADATIIGPVTAPDITGNLTLKDQSNITFVRQPVIISQKDRESVMQFVDMDTVRNEFIVPPAQTGNNIDYALINYNLNIDISKNAQFNIIVDPVTRDELQIKGAGQLNAGVSPNGTLSVTGAYNLSKGSYQMNYQFLKRKFDLQEGSTLVFTGDPQNAEADITAIYDINVSPYDLISNEVSNNSVIDTRLYSQKVPFQVILRITGRILTPKLQFDLKLKENVAGINYNFSTTIDNKLTQLRGDASSMNKQVFGLLVMGRFISEQSTDFFGTIGGTNGIQAQDIVKESVSRFLSDAVNQVASDLIKGVDINVDLRSAQDYSNATQRTDLNVALSKRFLNDRLSITVGKNFTVQGEDPMAKAQQSGANAQFMPDITTTYKLSKDGRYMMKAYQRNQYEAILDGYFVQTGVAFTLSMDYNKFNEILHKNRK